MRINANVGIQVCSRSRSKWNDKTGSTLEIIKDLCHLKPLAVPCLSCLGDSFIMMGLNSSRSDPNLWIRASHHHIGCDCIANFVDDLIVVAKELF